MPDHKPTARNPWAWVPTLYLAQGLPFTVAIKVCNWRMLLVLCLFFRISASAGIALWTNTSGGKWSEGANWSPNWPPNENDTVIITNAGTYTVMLDMHTTISSLSLGGGGGNQTLTNNNKILILNNASIVNSGGVFELGGDLYSVLMVASNAVVHWTGGYVLGSLTVAANGELNISGNRPKELYGPLTNAGRVKWSGGDLRLDDYFSPGHFNNLTNGLFDIQNDQAMHSSGGSSITFENAGTIRKSHSSGIGWTQIALRFFNTGIVTIQSGDLAFWSGPDSTFGGLFEVADGSLLYFGSGGRLIGTFATATEAVVMLAGGDFTCGPQLSFNGPGFNVLYGGTLRLLDDLIPNLELQSGTISLSPTFQGGTITNLSLNEVVLDGTNTVTGTATLGGSSYGPLTIASNGIVNWTGGDFGQVTVLSNGTLNVTGNSTKNLLLPLINYGTVNWSGGDWNIIRGLMGDGAIHNREGGTFKVQCDQRMQNSFWHPYPDDLPENGEAFFFNEGFFLKSGMSGISYISPFFTNSGTVSAVMGTIHFAGTYSSTASGMLDISLAGTALGSAHGHIRFTDRFQATDSFTVSTRQGFRPNPGSSFNVLSYPPSSGEFTCLNGLDLGDGIFLIPQFNQTYLTLTAFAYATNITQPQLFISRSTTGARLSWPLGFSDWVLESTTNLFTPFWQPVSAQCDNQATVTNISPHQYFRLKH